MPRVEAAPSSSSDGLALIGPTVLVHVGFDPTFAPGHMGMPEARDLPALVDTGATESSIDSELARQLGLPRVDQQIIAGAGGKHTIDVFLAQMYVPELGQAKHGQFAGVHLTQGDSHHKAILGRDFLSRIVMIYDGPGERVTLLI